MIKKVTALFVFVGFYVSLSAMPFPTPTSSMLSHIDMLKFQILAQKQKSGATSNIVTIRVYKCDEPVAVNADDRKHAEQKQAIAAKIVDN
jgi:hypothetical protein